MKFPIIAVAIALSASIVDVSAAPLRVLLIDAKPANSPVAVSNMRFGHAIPNVIVPIPSTAPSDTNVDATDVPAATERRRGCGRRRHGLSFKLMQISNAFRHFFGLPEIQYHHGHHHHHHNHSAVTDTESPSQPGEYRILPFIGTPPTFVKVDEQTGEVRTKGGDTVHIMPFPYPGQPLPQVEAVDETFLQRLTGALMSLGSFESKVVAFVLGCGLGVLLRMIWVLGVVTYRSIKGEREEEDNEYTHILVDDIDPNAEIIFVAPPQYTDEKAPIEPERN